jgi:uroporphyrinogen-III synthase
MEPRSSEVVTSSVRAGSNRLGSKAGAPRSAPPASRRLPLDGVRVVVTRAASQAEPMVAALRRLGATAIPAPVIEVVAPRDGGAALAASAARLACYDWVAFTSSNAVERLLAALSRPWPCPAPLVAAVGAATAARCRAAGLEVSIVPERAVAEELVSSMPLALGPRHPLVLWPRGAGGRTLLADGLAAAGYDVHAVDAYDVAPVALSGELRAAIAAAHVVTFTSASTVRALLEQLDRTEIGGLVACLGPITTAAARAAGLEVAIEAPPGPIDGLLEAIAGLLSA